MRLLPITLGLVLAASCSQRAGTGRPPPYATADLPSPGPTLPAGAVPHLRPVDRSPAPSPGGAGGGAEGGSGGGGGTGGSGGEPPTDIVLADTGARLGGDQDGERSSTYTGLGAGLALVDLDGDGDLDLLVSAELNPLHAFVNEGSFRFHDGTAGLGLSNITSSAAFALGDCDGDGTLEILVSRSGTNVLLRRGGDGTWSPVADAGLGDVPQHGLSAELLDLDGDGDLDVFQAIYLPDDSSPAGEKPRVFFNDGTCHFRQAGDVGLEPGMGVDFGFLDADGDGDPDVLVSNDFGMLNGPARLYENTGGAFRLVPSVEGLFFGMGATVADLDGDGRLDVFVTNIGRNPWYRNEGRLDLVDRSPELNLESPWYIDPRDPPRTLPYYDPNSTDSAERNMARFVRDYLGPRPDDEQAVVATAWSASAVDLDADGWLDLFLTRGPAGITTVPEGLHQSLGLFQGSAAGYRDVSARVGFDFPGTFKGSTVGDLDGDGLPDLVVFDHRFGNPAPRHLVLRNASSAGNWIRVDLAGRPPNGWGIGALVEVQLPDHALVQRRSLHVGTYSASADTLFFGIGAATEVDVKVTWPWGGGVTLAPGVPAGSTVTVRQDGG